MRHRVTSTCALAGQSIPFRVDVPHGGQCMTEIAWRVGQRDGGGVHRVGYKAWKPQRWESHHSLIEN